MKKFTFKGVLDGLRSSVQPPTARQEQEFQEQLRSENFTLKRTFRHGFPYSPTSFAFDPVQRLLAIGDKSGLLRILGRPGVDIHIRHESETPAAVIHMQFLINEGAIVTVTADDTLHLWNIRHKTPQVVQSLKFQRERITCLHLPVGSKWLYVGTEKGNIHVIHIATFSLSGYIINWNKAMEVVRTSHPGAVIALCDNPTDANKLLIAFECGLLVLWDLKGKNAEIRWQSPEPVMSIAWHYEGKYFVSSHVDGSICSWPTKPIPKPQSYVFPHGKRSKEGTVEKCKPIYKVDLKTTRLGETFTIFSGGMPSDKGGKSNCVTVMVGKITTVLEMEHNVVDFITLCENPWSCETQEPYAIAVLLQNDLVLIDLLTPGFPCFESPYPMDLHESPVTCCTYLTDCPSDLVPAFYSVGRSTTSKKTGFSDREWPISGGEWSPVSCSYSEIVITGHQDGSLKFWDSGAGALQILYKLKTAKIFEKAKGASSDGMENPLAIQLISLCPESRRLCVAGAIGHVMLFKFRKAETSSEVLVLDVPILYENFDDLYGISPESELFPQQAVEANESEKAMDNTIKVKIGAQRKPPGFQSQLVCITTGPNRRYVQITSLCINSSYGIMAYGTEYGLVIIDITQKVCLLSIACPDLYGGQDPYSRVPKSPKRNENKEEQSRSPSSDQLNDTASPESQSAEMVPETCDVTSSRSIMAAPEASDLGRIKESPIGEDVPTTSKDPQDRRKSVSWKTFNLKRQLSKVNVKIGLSVNADSDAEKSNSVFYTQESEKESSPEETNTESPKEEDLKAKENILDENTFERNCFVKNEKCCDSNTKSHVSSISNNSNLVAQNMSKTSVRDKNSFDKSQDIEFTKSKLVGLVQEEGEETQVPRPNDLPLFVSGTENTESIPVRPVRQKLKEKRDQRLLSVPNIKYQMRDVRTRSSKSDSSPSFAGSQPKRINKLEGSFSRSRSSSVSSIDMSISESVTCLALIESFTRKNDLSLLLPTLWIGTSFGSVLTLQITLPEKDARKSQPVLVTINGGPTIRLKGSITSLSFLDALGSVIPYSFEPWKDDSKEGRRDRTPTKSSTRTSPTFSSPTANTSSNSSGGNLSSGTSGSIGNALDTISDRQYVVVASEKQARVFDVNNQCCINKIQLAEMDFLVKAETVAMKDGSCLATYVSNGHLMVYSLPSLRLLMDTDFLPLMDLSFQTKCKQGIVDPMLSIWGQQLIVNEDTNQISKIFCFSNKGHGLYLASPTEIQKFSISAEFCQFIPEMTAELFMPHVMPEQPKDSFLKGLFGGGAKNFDREELFGEQSGKANRSVAKHIPGANIEQLGQRASTAASEISRAHQLALERGEKLNVLEERAERMANQAQDFSGTAHHLMLKYKDKKWYQL